MLKFNIFHSRTLLLFVGLIVSILSLAQQKKKGNYAFDLERNKYSYILIGNTYWITSNLRTSSFSNGDEILEVSTTEQWITACSNNIPAYCYYDFNSANAEKYGALYNFSAISDPRGLSPKGFFIPKENDWYNLIMYLGGRDVAGTKLKCDNNWGREEEYELANSSRMNILGSAGITENGEFYEDELSAYFWSTSVSLSGNPIIFTLNEHSGSVDAMELSKCGGYSIRAVKAKSSN